ncbi:restriction endonuclease subunit S [Lactobacillus intestinalis]|nr:restriction endonuclease subunit S [Lactobacillus intestinalis]UTW39991.1 restriction endonuclease subunit S [Lactobacillus intestinalis]
MEDKKLVPKLRFPGFTDPWEQHKLGNVANFINGRAYSQNELLDEGKYKVLRVGNFYTNDSWYYSNMELDDKYYANDGDLLYTWSATFGPHIWRGEKVIYHYHIWKIELSQELDKRFAIQLLLRDKNILESNTNGSTMAHITKKGMEEKKVRIPSKIQEQSTIGMFLKDFDTLITLHQRKLTDLEKMKSGLLQKMFPKNGEDKPEIRFPEFTDAWEQHKLGEIVTSIIAGGDIDKSKILKNGKYPVYANALTNDGLVGYYEDKYRVEAPAVTVTGRGEIGIAKARNCNFTPVVRLLAINSSHNNYFLANIINTHKTFVESTGVPQLTVPQLSNYKMKFPNNLKEENKIGEFFSQLDTLITLHQRKLKHLELQKKALLQQMFV